MKPINSRHVSGLLRHRAWTAIPHVTVHFRLIAAAQVFDAGC